MSPSRPPKHPSFEPKNWPASTTRLAAKPPFWRALLPQPVVKRQETPLSAKQMARFTRQLATLLGCGIALPRALDLLQRSLQDAAISDVAGMLKTEVMQGVSLSDALATHPSFRRGYAQLVAAGERSGTLALQVGRLGDQWSRHDAFQRQLWSAMIYPITVLVVAAAVTVALLTLVVPTLAVVFDDMGAPLPAPTQWVLRISGALAQWGGWALVWMLGIGWGLRAGLQRSTTWQRRVARWELAMPGWGRVRRAGLQSRWADSLSTLLGAGVPLVDALEATAQASANPILSHHTLAMRQHVVGGMQLSQAMHHTAHFEPLLLELAAVGEEAGTLGDLLARAAQGLDADFNAGISRFTSLIEPCVIVLLGGMIAAIVLAMYLPMFHMGQVL